MKFHYANGNEVLFDCDLLSITMDRKKSGYVFNIVNSHGENMVFNLSPKNEHGPLPVKDPGYAGLAVIDLLKRKSVVNDVDLLNAIRTDNGGF